MSTLLEELINLRKKGVDDCYQNLIQELNLRVQRNPQNLTYQNLTYQNSKYQIRTIKFERDYRVK